MQRLKFVLLIILIVELLTACIDNNPKPLVENVDAWIDPSIQGKERAIIADILRTLPALWRDEVVYLAEDGNFYVNKPSLRTVYRKAKPVSEGVYELANGTLISMPKESEQDSSIDPLATPCPNVGTGFYRRISTAPGSNDNALATAQFAYSRADVGLPLNTAVFQNKGEGAHIYLGGKSSTGNGIDSGVFYDVDPDRYPNGAWSAFHRQGDYSYGPWFQPGTTLTMEFWIHVDGHATLRLTGTLVPHPANTNNPVFVHAAAGMNSSGAGNVFKRVTSLAQPEEQQRPDSGAFVNGVKWFNVRLGRNAPEITTFGLHTWGQFGPDAQVNCKTEKVEISGIEILDETISINLNP